MMKKIGNERVLAGYMDVTGPRLSFGREWGR